MKAIQVTHDSLIWSDTPDPEPGPGEVVIRVEATAVNRADLSQRQGSYPPPPGASPILGLECSGVIEAVGPGVNPGRLGEPVCALLSGGGYAQKVVCPATHTLPVPKGLSLLEAAALPEVMATAWLNLRQEGQLQNGERVLLHAAASGVGTAALQLCRNWGCPVFAVVGSSEKAARCQALGAERTSLRQQDPWAQEVRAWGGVDVILDPVGGSILEPNLQCLKPQGRLVCIGLLGGKEGTLPMGLLMVKRLTVRGSVLRSRSREEKDAILAGLLREVWPLLEEGRVVPVIDRVYPIEEADRAHTWMASNTNVGKIILRVN